MISLNKTSEPHNATTEICVANDICTSTLVYNKQLDTHLGQNETTKINLDPRTSVSLFRHPKKNKEELPPRPNVLSFLHPNIDTEELPPRSDASSFRRPKINTETETIKMANCQGKTRTFRPVSLFCHPTINKEKLPPRRPNVLSFLHPKFNTEELSGVSFRHQKYIQRNCLLKKQQKWPTAAANRNLPI